MVSPVTGPFSRTVTFKGRITSLGYAPTWVYDRKDWSRQRKPYNLPLRFTKIGSVVSGFYTTDPKLYREYNGTHAFTSADTYYGGLYVNAQNQALARFRDAMKADQAQLGAALGERKKSLQMVESRAVQLFRAFNAIRRFRFGDAAKLLDIQRPKGLKKSSKSFANNVLEYSFGWAPLIGDIGNAIDTLQNGVPPCRIKGRGKNSTRVKSTLITGFNQINRDLTATMRVEYSAWVSITNPNLALANQLGLVNPAGVAWELVPFSFVVDYFVNVSQFLEHFSDYWGYSVDRTKLTYYYTATCPEEMYGSSVAYHRWVGEYVRLERYPNVNPGVSLAVRSPWVLSPKRALTSVALLLQQLR